MRSDKHAARIGPTSAARHLTADQIMEAYVLAVEHPHLAGCRVCQARYQELIRPLEEMREDATREADEVFTAERLHDQRDRIMRRIERHDHPAEVVRFPQRAAARPVRRVLGPARRWVAAAAAAGLAAGMFLGFAMDRRTHTDAMNAQLRPAAPPAVATWQSTASAPDEQFFVEIEEALIGSRVREMRADLSAIDVMTTPAEIRDVSYVR